MGQRHRRSDEKPAAELFTEVRAMRSWLGVRAFWVIAAVLSIAVVGVVVVLASGVGSEAAFTSPAPASESPENYDFGEYATPGWNNLTNEVAFMTRLKIYTDAAGLPPGNRVLRNIAIDNCLVMRAGRLDQLPKSLNESKYGAAGGKSEAWAINNAAIDVYCPDQIQNRYAVRR